VHGVPHGGIERRGVARHYLSGEPRQHKRRNRRAAD